MKKKSQPVKKEETPEEKGYDSDFDEINRNDITYELWRQPKLVRNFGERAAETRYLLSKAKSAFKLVKADLDGRIRKDPTAFGIEKATDNSVEQCIIRQEEYQRAERKMNRLAYDLDVIEAGLSAMADKKQSLKDMTSLYLAEGPYAEVNVRDPNLRETQQKRQRDSIVKESGKNAKRRSEL